MLDLFKPKTRDERQAETIRAWLANSCHGTAVCCTGYGKTYVALKIIKALRKKNPTLNVLIVVPTELLKTQWEELLTKYDLYFYTHVSVMMGASKRGYVCDLLIIDEAHKINSETICQIFNNVRYKMILGLTATFERLDGRHEILAQYAPVCDTVTIQEALVNGWVSQYKDYVVLLNVPDIETYKEYNKEFVKHFEFFGFSFQLAMSKICSY